METACLSIKFTPLIKEAEKHLNSNCYLEIVPEVSRLENLDKLKWDRTGDCIEYTVPMTYTIILRKQNRVEKTFDKLDKTYHSCVDLLWSSLKSSHDLTSNNLSRIISDTIILSTLPSSAAKIESFISNPLGYSTDVFQSRSVTNATACGTSNAPLVAISKETDQDVISQDVISDDTSKVEPQQYEEYTTRQVKSSCDVVTNTEDIVRTFADEIRSECGTNTISDLPNKRTYMLSFAPMCSVNTQATADSSNEGLNSKAVNCNLHDCRKDVLMANLRNRVIDIPNQYIVSNMYSEFDNLFENNYKKAHYASNDKSSPAMRIAQYVRYMETELLPLNVFLDNLIIKCSLLGMKKNTECNKDNLSNYSLLCKNINEAKNTGPKETCEKLTSNRVVYSIVLDE